MSASLRQRAVKIPSLERLILYSFKELLCWPNGDQSELFGDEMRDEYG